MKIYVIFRNDDMTEGRGPMVPFKIMLNKQAAISYAMNKPGVMGVVGRQERVNKPCRLHWSSSSQTGVMLVDGDWEVREFEPEE